MSNKLLLTQLVAITSAIVNDDVAGGGRLITEILAGRPIAPAFGGVLSGMTRPVGVLLVPDVGRVEFRDVPFRPSKRVKNAWRGRSGADRALSLRAFATRVGQEQIGSDLANAVGEWFSNKDAARVAFRRRLHRHYRAPVQLLEEPRS